MAKTQTSKYRLCLVSSLALNLFFLLYLYLGRDQWELSWSRKAAIEAEAVAAISCSGHGVAYLDGLVVDENGKPICECFTCYGGPHCSQFLPSCSADADSGDPLFLETFWMHHAASSAIVVAGWHRMSYSFSDDSTISKELEKHIRQLHAVVGNAVTKGKYIVFGAGSTQLLNAAVHALSPDNSSSPPARVVASIPFYPVYQIQTDYFASVYYKFLGDASLWKNSSDVSTNIIEFVTSPNNPDGQLKKAVLDGPNVKTIYDRAYYWPHYTPIPAPADDDLMIFTLSKLSGHAGSRFGWALIKDEAIYQKMMFYLTLNTMGVSRETQLKALKILKVILENGGKEIFEFGHKTMSNRWKKLSQVVSLSKRFSLQDIPPQYCIFSKKIREASSAYAWLKCEREEDEDCYAVLKEGNITGREANKFFAENRYVRLSILRRQHDFDLLVEKLNKLIAEEDGPKIM